MTSVMWHFRQPNNFLIICILILCAGFMLQFKVLYNKHQKYLRIQEIKVRMTEIEDTLNSVEVVANTTSVVIKKLERKVKRQRRKFHIKNR